MFGCFTNRTFCRIVPRRCGTLKVVRVLNVTHVGRFFTISFKKKGVFNLHALNDIIKWQKLNYDFGFHPFEFQTNIRLLVLSESKSLLNVSIRDADQHSVRAWKIVFSKQIEIFSQIVN
jgi:hypothetical protein